MGFLKKQFEFVSKSIKLENLTENAYQTKFYRKNDFSALLMTFFLPYNQKTLKVGKVRKYDEETVYLRKERRFHLPKSLLHKNGKAQNMLVLTGRLVFFLLKYYW